VGSKWRTLARKEAATLAQKLNECEARQRAKSLWSGGTPPREISGSHITGDIVEAIFSDMNCMQRDGPSDWTAGDEKEESGEESGAEAAEAAGVGESFLV